MSVIFSPSWFLGIDIAVEIFSFLILSVFFFLSIKNYRITKNKKALYLGIGFLLIAIAEIFTVFSKFAIYYDIMFTHRIGKFIISYTVARSTDIIYNISFFFHRFLTLLGFYIIYRLPMKTQKPEDIFLALYFLVISALFGTVFYYLFHITAVVLLVLIINNYYRIYLENRSKNTKLLVNALIILLIGHFIFILSNIRIVYVVAQLIQLISYIMLLWLIIRILQYGKKKKQVRHRV